MASSEHDLYWLDDPDPERLASEMTKRINNYAERMQSSGRVNVWRRMSRLYYDRDADSSLTGTQVTIGGEGGELIGTRANSLGRFVRAVSVLVTGSRPSYSARSIASSSEGIAQVAIANAWLDFVLSKKGAEQAARRAQIYQSLYGQGWLTSTWDERSGRPVGFDELGRQRFEGDILVTAKRPDEVVYDIDLDENTPHEWIISARQINRYRLANMYPQLKSHILESSCRTRLDDIRDTLRLDGSSMRALRNNDVVTVYELFAPPSPQTPEGRYGMMLGGKMVALDRAIYDDLAHYEMNAENEPGTRNGHSFLWGLIGLQQVSDAVLSSIITVVENYGKPVLFEPTDNVVSTDKGSLGDPFHLVKGSQAPSFVSLDANILSPLISAKQTYDDAMVQISGLNDAALGDAGKSQSGEALATMHSLALQSVSASGAAYADAFSAMMTGCILRVRTFAKTERIIQVAGKTYAGDAIKFKGSSLSSIDGVDVEMSAASMRHAAGRKEFADKMWAAQAIEDPEDYLEAMATGRYEPILDRPRSQRALIEGENERLRMGQSCWVSPTDDHRHHIAQHSVLLDDAKAREPNPDGSMNPMIMAAIMHTQEHLAALKAMDPDLAEALGQQPLTSVIQAAEVAAQAAAQPPVDPNAQPVDPNVDPNMDPNAAPVMQGAEATGANGGLPPTGADGADVAQTDMPLQ